MSVTSANRLELLQIADAVAREKMIEPKLVIEAMEESYAKAARSRFGAELDIRAKIDPKTGELTMTRVRTVVEEVENGFQELLPEDAAAYLDDPKVGDQIVDELPAFDMGRIAAQSAKQVIMQKVREAERERQYEEFKDRMGEIINGVVKRTEYGNIIVDVGRGEAVLRRDQLINREAYRNGDRIRAYIRDVRSE
ncbi:MAG: NusA N-terminal domain-containing protein, partial [Pseudomonadota bacterium]